MELTHTDIILGVLTVVGGISGWMFKRDRSRIDSDIDTLGKRVEEVKKCLDRDMEVAMKKVSQVEHNYVQRLDALKDSIHTLNLNITKEFGDLRGMLAEKYMSKAEAERAYNHIKGMVRDGESPVD